MQKLILTAVLTALVVLALVVLAAVVVARTGAVSVAGTADYLPGTEWFFSTLKRSSVAEQARAAVERGEMQPPSEVTEDMLRHGASHYRSMCVICHGAPGVPRGEVGQGLKPRPPELSQVARDWSREEIYWVLEHGIRHTGMPAFGETHSPEELWGLTAFVERLDGMSAEEYRQRTGGAAAGGGGHGHDDGHDHAHGQGAATAGGEAAAEGAAAGPAEEAGGEGAHDHDDHEH